MKRILLFADVLMIPTNQRKRSRGLRIGLNSVFIGKAFSYMLLFFLILFSTKNYGQCAYPTGATQFGSTITYCIDNSGTISNNVPAGRFVLLNVIQGFTYRFRINNVFGGTDPNEIVSIYNAANNNGLATSAGSGGVDFNWTATLSGQVKVLISRGGTAPSGCVNDGSGPARLQINLTSIGNNIDSQTAFGTNTWRGHIYNAGGSTPAPFTNANYAGYYDIASETIAEGFGGDTACFSVLSQGSQRATMYTEGYAVRYRMKTTRSGCYFVNFRGDDGIRLTLNGTSVFDRWVEQGPTNYSSVLVRLDGDDDFVLDYYENGGQNEVGFSLTPFDANANTITAPTTVNLCSNGNPSVIEGSLQYSSADATFQNPQLNFQWQLSTDGGAYANISGATGRTYDPPAIANATSANIVRRFKRLVTLNTANVPDINGVRTNCLYNESNVVTITTSPATPATPGTISGTTGQCPAVTGQVYSIAAVTNALSYTWAVPTGWSITSGQGTNSITLTTGSAGQNGNVSVTATNGCGTSTARTLAVTVNAAPTIAAISTPAALCSGGSLNPTAPTVTANGSTVTASGWQLETAVASGTYSNLTVPYTVAFADNGKRIRYYATNTCGTTNSNVVTLTVNAAPTIAAISAPAVLCSGGSLNPTAPTVTANGSTVTASGWQLETAVASGTYSNLTVPYTVAFADNGKRIRYYATNTCGTTNSNVESPNRGISS
ncbi:hypothetical protein FLAVO9R_130053 [Flavobacterium sp. 9R]|uniref:hypothetical protein n=1 Tax=Flavobacterium sp. 9R TaxID=2653143 RepID=UPI0012EF085B|nr:hypothetical protein [Flavobacterium sp. 9R]VXB35199.1 hypothetical protein FLAVO9R_130053 [Flavobacterium sp. 9R]